EKMGLPQLKSEGKDIQTIYKSTGVDKYIAKPEEEK
ncbi:unnamed protein product, partial [marine sediment metagenome]